MVLIFTTQASRVPQSSTTTASTTGVSVPSFRSLSPFLSAPAASKTVINPGGISATLTAITIDANLSPSPLLAETAPLLAPSSESVPFSTTSISAKNDIAALPEFASFPKMDVLGGSSNILGAGSIAPIALNGGIPATLTPSINPVTSYVTPSATPSATPEQQQQQAIVPTITPFFSSNFNPLSLDLPSTFQQQQDTPEVAQVSG